MNGIPLVITDANGKVVLKNAAASKIIEYYADMKRHFSADAEATVRSLERDSVGVVSLRGLGKYKYALVKRRSYTASDLFIYILLDTDAKETAFLANDAKIVCRGVAEAQKDIGEIPSEKAYMRALEIRNLTDDMAFFFSDALERRPFSELIDEFETGAANLELFSSSLEIRYEKSSFAALDRQCFSPVPFCALLLLLATAAKLSSDKKLILSIGYFDNSAEFCLMTEVKGGSGVIYRGADIFDTGIADDAARSVLRLCSELSGAEDKKIFVSLDGASGKSRIRFEYRLKNYEKRSADIKTDTEFAEE